MTKLTNSLFFLIMIYASACSNQQPQLNLHANSAEVNVEKNLSPAELRNQLRSLEESNPPQYMAIETSFTPNKVLIQKASLFSHSKYAEDGYLLTGTIKNNASVARFKDAEIIITFLSETNTAIASKKLILYKYLNPNEPISFEFKVYPPDGTKTYKVEINTAQPA